LGENWNRKYIRAIQTVLNATKGKIGRGKSFFYKAFGKDINEFEKILIMPETYILFRYFFEDSGYTENWWNEFESYENSEKEKIKIIIKNNEFKGFNKNGLKKQSIDFIEKHYLISREDIKNPKSKYYKEKEEYDLSKTIA
jgi:lipopolysaccharide biosynthesis protein